MEEPVDGNTRADGAAPRRERRAGGRRVAALVLAALACLMLVHWLTYRVEKVTTDPAYIELIPPTASGLTAVGASPPPSQTPSDASRRTVERPRDILFAPASLSSSVKVSNGS